MRQIICDGCKDGEEFKGDAKAGKTIKPVKIELVHEGRVDPREILQADLCTKCWAELLNKYFRQTIDTTEALIEPESLKAGFVPVEERELEETHS